MPRIHVVDVPEFRPVVDSAKAREADGYRVIGPRKGYFTIEKAGEMSFNRKDMKLPPAIWYGIFTGGLNGEISSFGREVVTIIGTNQPL
ncbi:hypothetical protein [Pseudooceanicola sp.]|jgi:hypothetical protein|uniref:hypothetical protein n=1 Tax=Pseudooceanicola sp. TaxID=1914328 RepID=UPI0040592B66